MTTALDPVPTANELVPITGSRQSRARSDLFDPRPSGPADRIGARWSAHRPIVTALFVLLYAYVALALVTVGIGLVVVATLTDTWLGERDLSVNRWLVDARTPTWNAVSLVGSTLANTPVVVAVAGVAVIALLLTRRWPAALFLTAGLLLEVTVFVTAAFLVDRDRPDVVRLDQAPPTSSYPSGHTAASVALYIGLALVLFSITRLLALRIAGFVAASSLVVFVAVSRMYRGMHHLSDVIAGVLLGAACLAAALLAARTARAVEARRAEIGEASP